MCVEYQLRPRTGALFYVTDVVLPPIIFGVGLVGNLLLILVLSRRPMRRDSAVYVYYTAAAAIDLAALLCAVPAFVRDVDVLPLSVANSRPMSYAVWGRRGVEPVLRHAAGWLTATAAGVRSVDAQLGASSSRWTRISVSRVVAFVIVVACVLLDFTRFLDAAVVELADHCFAGVRLWSLNVTDLGRQRFYAELQPAASTVAGETLPLALSLLFAMILLVGHLRCCRRSPSAARRTPGLDDHQLSVTVFALSTAFVVLDGPTAAVGLIRVFYFRSSAAAGSEDLYHPSLVARCLSLARCAVNCVIVTVVNYDFRVTMRRTCCCWCAPLDDVYFEPVTCCGRPRHRGRPKRRSWNQLEVDYMTTADVFTARNSPAPNSGQLRQITGQRVQDNDSSLWI